MTTLFISDLHLNQLENPVTQSFLRLLQEARHADALYILGDLFELWIGDDDTSPLQEAVTTALHDLQVSGTPCYFIHGNRDFLVGPKFAAASGLPILPEEVVVDLYGVPTLLLHGDTLCSSDSAYQRLRRWVRRPWLQRLFLALPLTLRKLLAAKLRSYSTSSARGKRQEIMDVDQQSVERTLLQHGVLRMIHGHTHRPAVHTFAIGSSAVEAERIVLGAWESTTSVLQVTADGFQLTATPL